MKCCSDCVHQKVCKAWNEDWQILKRDDDFALTLERNYKNLGRNCEYFSNKMNNHTKKHNYSRLKLTEDDVKNIKNLQFSNLTQTQIAEKFGVCQATISRIFQNK